MVDLNTISSPGTTSRAGSRAAAAGERSAAAADIRPEAGAAVSSVPATQVTVTETVAMLRQIEEQISNVPMMDNERVVALREAIRNGTFQIDARKTAEKLLAFV